MTAVRGDVVLAKRQGTRVKTKTSAPCGSAPSPIGAEQGDAKGAGEPGREAGPKTTWGQYGDRLARVAAYIHDNLGEDLDLERIAEVACLSPWHWHRIYREVHGETIAATVRRLSLHRAAGDLARTDLPLIRIAERAGYPNVRSFARTFAEAYGATPARYRIEARRVRPGAGDEGDPPMVQVDIRAFPETTLVGVAFKGPYMEVGRAFDTLMHGLHAQGLVARTAMPPLALSYDDPGLVPASELRSFAAVPVRDGEAVHPVAPLELRTIVGGDYAVHIHKGPYAELGSTFQWLYRVWLPQSGRERRDEPPVEIYLNDMRTLPPSEWLTEIRIPLV